MKSQKYIAYTYDFVSFILENISADDLQKIKTIVLFGSVARKQVEKNSDIDLFIELFTEKESEKLEQKLIDILEKFLKSSKEKKYWNLMGITLPFSFKVGTEDTWKKLIPSLLEDGITIFQKYIPEKLEGKHYTLFSWENIKPAYTRTFLHKKIFGYIQNKIHYIGLLDNFSGRKVGKGTILVPFEHQQVFMELFRKHGITVKIFDVTE